MSKKLFMGMIAIVITAFVTSCEKENITKIEDEQIATEYNETSENGLKSGTYCSYPFSAVTTVSTIGINKSYSLIASQTTDKKWTWRSATAGGEKFRKFRMKITNNHSSYPIIVRAVGVKGVVSETYTLLEGCFTVNAGQSITIRFDNISPLYNSNFSAAYKCVDWEVIVKNGNEIGQTATSVPVKIELASWTTTEP